MTMQLVLGFGCCSVIPGFWLFIVLLLYGFGNKYCSPSYLLFGVAVNGLVYMDRFWNPNKALPFSFPSPFQQVPRIKYTMI